MERERDGHGRIGRSVGRSVGRRAISRPITHLVRRRALRPMGYIVRASVGQRGNKLWADQGSRLLLSGPSSSGDGGGSVTITTRRSFRWFGTEPMYYLYYCLPVLSLSFLSLLPSPPAPSWRGEGRGECVGESFFFFFTWTEPCRPRPPPGHRRRVFPSLGTHARTMRAI